MLSLKQMHNRTGWSATGPRTYGVLEKEKEKLERDLNVLVHRKDDKVLNMLEKDKTVQGLKVKKEALETQLKEFRKKQKDQHNL